MKRLLILGILGCFLCFSLTILAQVPQLLNYQGRLTDDVGNAITTATTVRFSLYQGGDASTPGSGTLVYEEDATVTPDSNGVFDHTIGSGTVVYGTLDATVFYTKHTVYLEITVDPAGVADTLLPRKQVVSVGYSFVSEKAIDADKVDGQHASDFALVGHHHDAEYVNEGQADSVTSAMIVDGTIVDADINSGANIAGSKIDPTGLDADLLDGKDSLDFVHTTGDDMTGALSVTVADTYYALFGRNTTATDTRYGVLGRSDSTDGFGLYGFASATSGTNYGVYGRSDSISGKGIYGWASASSGTNCGIFGVTNSSSGYGVYGTAPTYAVYGYAQGSDETYGVYGKADSSYGYGVYGTAPTYGVYGKATATTDTNFGVLGSSSSTNGRGVSGWASAFSGTNYGVYGVSDSTSGRGVYGLVQRTSGINYGVYGITYSSSGYGVYGKNPAGGYAGYFEGKAHVTGNLTVEGSKPCVQPIDNGKKVLLYAMESPEIWFEDFGTEQLVNGQAVVQIESVFSQTANIEMGYLVFLTPRGECHGLYISRQDKNSFEVRELGGGTSNISFYYRIVAKRRGYEDVRFEEFTEPEASPEEAKVKQPKHS